VVKGVGNIPKFFHLQYVFNAFFHGLRITVFYQIWLFHKSIIRPEKCSANNSYTARLLQHKKQGNGALATFRNKRTSGQLGAVDKDAKKWYKK